MPIKESLSINIIRKHAVLTFRDRLSSTCCDCAGLCPLRLAPYMYMCHHDYLARYSKLGGHRMHYWLQWLYAELLLRTRMLKLKHKTHRFCTIVSQWTKLQKKATRDRKVYMYSIEYIIQLVVFHRLVLS